MTCRNVFFAILFGLIISLPVVAEEAEIRTWPTLTKNPCGYLDALLNPLTSWVAKVWASHLESAGRALPAAHSYIYSGNYQRAAELFLQAGRWEEGVRALELLLLEQVRLAELNGKITLSGENRTVLEMILNPQNKMRHVKMTKFPRIEAGVKHTLALEIEKTMAGQQTVETAAAGLRELDMRTSFTSILSREEFEDIAYTANLYQHSPDFTYDVLTLPGKGVNEQYDVSLTYSAIQHLNFARKFQLTPEYTTLKMLRGGINIIHPNQKKVRKFFSFGSFISLDLLKTAFGKKYKAYIRLAPEKLAPYLHAIIDAAEANQASTLKLAMTANGLRRLDYFVIYFTTESMRARFSEQLDQILTAAGDPAPAASFTQNLGKYSSAGVDDRNLSARSAGSYQLLHLVYGPRS